MPWLNFNACWRARADRYRQPTDCPLVGWGRAYFAKGTLCCAVWEQEGTVSRRGLVKGWVLSGRLQERLQGRLPRIKAQGAAAGEAQDEA
jgi:hypothetical protein